MKATVRSIACRLMVEARLIRRIMETVISNTEDEVQCPRSASTGLLKPTTLDLAKECDPERLILGRDFKCEDFDTAKRMIDDPETWRRLSANVSA